MWKQISGPTIKIQEFISFSCLNGVTENLKKYRLYLRNVWVGPLSLSYGGIFHFQTVSVQRQGRGKKRDKPHFA